MLVACVFPSPSISPTGFAQLCNLANALRPTSCSLASAANAGSIDQRLAQLCAHNDVSRWLYLPIPGYGLAVSPVTTKLCRLVAHLPSSALFSVSFWSERYTGFGRCATEANRSPRRLRRNLSFDQRGQVDAAQEFKERAGGAAAISLERLRPYLSALAHIVPGDMARRRVRKQPSWQINAESGVSCFFS